MGDEDDDYVSYGTPLPEIEDEYVLRKKAARELEVRDEKGRQRFHGAFTGGFSAGYFNTVGTKEGWAPKSFVSSRAAKAADQFQQNPEDFMDEEDFGEFGIATRKIHTTTKFQNTSDGQVSKRKFNDADTVIPGIAPLRELVKPVKESIGIEILKKLGWKFGQGIGPRVKKQSAAKKVYGCSPYPEAPVPEEDPFTLSFTFAPEDTVPEIYRIKDDVFGLGYTGLSKESVLSAHIDLDRPTSTKSWLKKDKRKLTISGQAFGVGAFEDDDADIYSKDDMSQYDFSELEVAGTSNEPGYKKPGQSSNNSVIEGFVPASHPPPTKKYYPPPQIPPNFKPIRATLPPLVPSVTADQHFLPRHNLSAADRSLVLGEKKFQSFQQPADKKVNERTLDFVTEKKEKSPMKTHSFRPFVNDEPKQKRYEEYLRLKNTGEEERLEQPRSMTEWEKQQELEEFARASFLFKPLSAALSSKFQSGSHLSVTNEVIDAIEKAKKSGPKPPVTKRTLVGLQNRKTSEWHPASLLCKRLNVPNPYPDSEASGVKESKSLFLHLAFQGESSTQMSTGDSTLTADSLLHIPELPTSEDVKQSAAKNQVEFIETARSDILDPPLDKRPPIDFFKDIFENSSSEDDENETSAKPAEPLAESQEPSPTSAELETAKNKELVNLGVSKPKMQPAIKPGFGVFANLDLDALNQRTPAPKVKPEANTNDLTVSEERLKIEDNTVSERNSGLSEDLYGPELPPDYDASSSVDKKLDYKKLKARHKEKHKSKHHKHKSKKKKKKKSSRKDSEDSSVASDEDIPPTVILEKLKKLQNIMKTHSS